MCQIKVAWALLWITGSVFVCNGQRTLDSQKCNVTVLDHCGNQVTSLRRNLTDDRPPQTKEEIKNQCEIHNHGYKCIVSFSNECLDPLRRQIMLISMTAFRRTLDDTCSENGLEDFVKDHASCLEETFDHIQSCIKNILLKLEGITDSIKREDQLQTSCCTFSEFTDCTVSVVKEKCETSSLQYLQRFIGGSSSDMLDLVCLERDHRAEGCKKLLEPLVQREEPKYKSVFPSLIKIMESIG